MKDVDVERFRISSQQRANAKTGGRRGLPLPAKGEPFFAGPVPWGWWTTAARLSGKSLQVATAIWHIAAMKKSPRIKLQGKILRELGVSRKAVYRILRNFERVGLVACERGSGQSATITVLGLAAESNGN